MWQLLLFGTPASLFLAMTIAALLHLRWAQRLPALVSLNSRNNLAEPPTALVTCSVIVPARDEAERIGEAVRRLLAQQGVKLEIIVVDDRSTDGTGEIARQSAAGDPRLHVERIDTLPDGWLGKCHACYVGAAAATGDWILFTDADCWMKPDVIARALLVAERDAVDHVVLTAGLVGATLGARAIHMAFLMTLLGWLARVNQRHPKAYVGMGAFNLVRSSIYRKSGGYEKLRLTVIDDVKLGLVVRQSGGFTRAFIGGDDTACQWGVTIPSMIKILEKNYFAAINFNLPAALLVSIGGTLIWCLAMIGPFTASILGITAGVAFGSMIIPALTLSRRLGWSPAPAVLMPFVHLLLFYALLKSALVTVRQGGIRWRGTFYSLAVLRKGNFQR